jgi:hypothetical protein
MLGADDDVVDTASLVVDTTVEGVDTAVGF